MTIWPLIGMRWPFQLDQSDKYYFQTQCNYGVLLSNTGCYFVKYFTNRGLD